MSIRKRLLKKLCIKYDEQSINLLISINRMYKQQ